MPTIRHFLSITDITPEETRALIERAIEMKAAPAGSVQPLAGKRIALLFEKPSLRTRVSFQMGISELGGFSMYLGQDEVGLGQRETRVRCRQGAQRLRRLHHRPRQFP